MCRALEFSDINTKQGPEARWSKAYGSIVLGSRLWSSVQLKVRSVGGDSANSSTRTRSYHDQTIHTFWYGPVAASYLGLHESKS
jgi:hypothetical protein